jgi:hypothetical protein
MNLTTRTLSFIAAAALAACGSATPSALKIDSAHTVALDGTIADGVIRVSTTDDARIAALVRSQLYYAIGQLNGIDSGTDMVKVQVSVGEKIDRGTYIEAHYAAKMLIAWDLQRSVPETYTFHLPAGGDSATLETFFETYQNDCIDPFAHDVSSGIFWYYYRPDACAIASTPAGELVTHTQVSLVKSVEATTGKSPEYTKVWEDGRLVVTAIYAKDKIGSQDDWDVGVSAYRELYDSLLEQYGQPKRQSPAIPGGATVGVKTPMINMVWDLPQGELDVDILLVDDIKMVDGAFKARYNERTRRSDFLSYSGHAGLGANIRALARMGEFVKGQYQLFLVNGCDTFAYVDNALRDAHYAVNDPSESKSKYFDMITNAMPAYFHRLSGTNMTVIDSLIGKQRTFREVLATFDPVQKAVVTGEEDNAFPNPF